MPSYAILGLGLSGQSAVTYLLSRGEQNLTIYVSPNEADAARRDYPSLAVKTSWEEIPEKILVRSPGIRPDRPGIARALARGARLTSEIELFIEGCPAPIYGVTGSDGKTTTATLAARLLEAAGKHTWLGGNIGVSLLPFLSEMRPTDAVVLELSSFQLMTFTPRLAAAAVTNLTENHLNWHTDMEEYARAKRNIFVGAARRVENACAPIAPAYPHLTFSATVENANYRMKDGLLLCGDEFLAHTRDLRVPGLYQRENLLCAAALTDAPAPAVAEVARTFTGVRYRCERVGECHGVTCYDSSIDTTPARTAVTLRGLPAPLTVLAGGRNKNLNLSPLADALIAYAAQVVFFGECGEEMLASLMSHPAYRGTPRAVLEPDFERAVALALASTPQGGTLVLSPAAASFDAFSSYRARGDAYRACLTAHGMTR